jgi:hypothetical protein
VGVQDRGKVGDEEEVRDKRDGLGGDEEETMAQQEKYHFRVGRWAERHREIGRGGIPAT